MTFRCPRNSDARQNRYTYVNGDPVNYWDPNGHGPCFKRSRWGIPVPGWCPDPVTDTAKKAVQQTAGVVKGAAEELIIDPVKALWNLPTAINNAANAAGEKLDEHLNRAVWDPLGEAQALGEATESITDPGAWGRAAKTAAEQVTAPIREDWRNGNYGEAVGRTIVLVAPLVTKALKALRAAEALEEVSTAAKAIREAEALDSVSNPVPRRVARVIDADLLQDGVARVGAPGEARPFVTAAEDIAGIQTSHDLAKRLTLMTRAGELRSGPLAILEFDTPIGLGSPVLRTNPGFVGFGRTLGGAREFDIPNLLVDELENLTIRTVQ